MGYARMDRSKVFVLGGEAMLVILSFLPRGHGANFQL